jgi:hypothetical protein
VDKETLDHISRCGRPGTVDGQALACVCIEYRQAFEPSPIGSLIVDKIIAPDMIGVCGPGRRRSERLARGRSSTRWAR